MARDQENEENVSHRIPTSTDVRDELDRLLGYPRFKPASIRGMLLRFMVEHYLADGGIRLTERFIGEACIKECETYEEAAGKFGFPRTRANLSSLRRTLRSYYETAGYQNPVVIAIPSYVPEVAYRTCATDSSGTNPMITQAMIAVTTRTTFGAQVALTCHDELSKEAEGSDNPELLARCACILYAASPSLPWETAKNRRTIDGYLRRCDGRLALPWEYTFAAACRECSHLHNWKRAGELFEAAAVGSDGESVQYWWHPALLASKGQFNEAIDLLKAAIGNSGTSASIGLRCDLGLIQLMAGRRDDAWATFDEITLFTPLVDNAVLVVMFLILCEATDEIPEACAMLKVYERRVGDTSDMYHSFDSFYGDPDEDEETHSSAPRVYGSHMHCWFIGVASLLAEPMGDEERAFRAYLLDESGFNTALALIALRRYDEAVASLERAAFEEEDPYSMWFHLLPPLRHLQHRDDFRKLLKRLNLPDYRWR